MKSWRISKWKPAGGPVAGRGQCSQGEAVRREKPRRQESSESSKKINCSNAAAYKWRKMKPGRMRIQQREFLGVLERSCSGGNGDGTSLCGMDSREKEETVHLDNSLGYIPQGAIGRTRWLTPVIPVLLEAQVGRII